MKTTISHLCADIWLYIFEYFNAVELFTILVHVTRISDELLFYKNQYVYLRKLILDGHTKNLPKELPFDQVISLELHEENCIDIVTQCSKLCSLKLIGKSEWITFILEKFSYTKMNLKQLVLVLPDIHLLPRIFSSISSMFSIRRLEIYANELEQKMKIENYLPAQMNVEQFLLDTCSSIGLYELAYILSIFQHIHLLNITLFYDNRPSLSLPILPNLQYICLELFEVPFEWIINLTRVAPILTKLKLMGLINGEGFITGQRWIQLFQSCPSLITVIVNVSLQSDTCFFLNETNRTLLRKINLDLTRIDDDSDIFSCEINQQRWLKLSGTISRDYMRL